MGIEAPSYEDERTLRVVEVDEFVLHTWDTYKGKYGKSRLGYSFYPNGGSPIFIGEDFFPSPMRAIDSDDILRDLLGFLTLRKGGTDPDYFADYTARQIDFRDTHAEELSLWALEPDEDFTPPAFKDLI